jgi:hypothetical protein
VRDAFDYLQHEQRAAAGGLLKKCWQTLCDAVEARMAAKTTHGVSFSELAEQVGQDTSTLHLWRKLHDNRFLKVC